MSDVEDVSISSPAELLSIGRRNLAVRDYSAAAEALAKACELLAAEHGDTADQCAEAYLWYGKSLLGLSREESGVLGDGMPGTGNADDDENGDQEDNDEEQNEDGEAEAEGKGKIEDEAEGESKMETQDNSVDSGTEVEKTEAESTTKDDEPTVVTSGTDDEKPGTSNGDAMDESMANLDNEDDIDNLQLAWEMLDLSRSILKRRAEGCGGGGGGDVTRRLLADVHLALGEVALESETYDKAVIDMMCCLEIQKELHNSDDRCIAETHYQIGLANSLASNFEDAVTHFKNAANILESRIKALENANPKDDATIKKYKLNDPFYSIEAEIKELKELLPEIHEKIQDMMDYKAETIKRVRETLCPENGEGSGEPSVASSTSSEPKPKPAASDISHLIKRKRKASDSEADSASKRVNT